MPPITVRESDASDSDAINALVTELARDFGGIDVLVSNLAFAKPVESLADLKRGSFELSLRYTAWPVVELVQASRAIDEIILVHIAAIDPETFEVLQSFAACFHHYARIMLQEIAPAPLDHLASVERHRQAHAPISTRIGIVSRAHRKRHQIVDVVEVPATKKAHVSPIRPSPALTHPRAVSQAESTTISALKSSFIISHASSIPSSFASPRDSTMREYIGLESLSTP